MTTFTATWTEEHLADLERLLRDGVRAGFGDEAEAMAHMVVARQRAEPPLTPEAERYLKDAASRRAERELRLVDVTSDGKTGVWL